MVVRENKRGLTDEQYADMLGLLKGLSAAERKLLADPDFITEDEADAIYADRELKAGGRLYSLDEVLKENGIPRRRPRA